MPLEHSFLWFGAIICFAYVVQTVGGFGSMLICVTLGAQFLPLQRVVELAVPLSMVQTAYIVWRHHDGIVRDLLLRRILPLMLLGMPLGYFGLRAWASTGLKPAFGVMVLLLSLRELYRLFRTETSEQGPTSRMVSTLAMLGAGVVHGIYATGGPLLVYALGREGLEKREFRSTLAMVWLVLNLVLVSGFLWEQRYASSDAWELLLLLPLAPLGIAIGEALHRKVKERPFKMLVFSMLVIASLSLIFR